MRDQLLIWADHWLSIRTGDPERDRRGRLLNFLLAGAILATIVLTLVNAYQGLTGSEPRAAEFVLSDLISVGLLLGVAWLNRRGATTLASYLFLGELLLAYIVFFPPEDLDRLSVMFVLPIMAASFVIAPAASFLFAMLSGAIFAVQTLGVAGMNPYAPLIYTLTFLVIALVTALAASGLESALRASHRQAEELRKINEE